MLSTYSQFDLEPFVLLRAQRKALRINFYFQRLLAALGYLELLQVIHLLFF